MRGAADRVELPVGMIAEVFGDGLDLPAPGFADAVMPGIVTLLSLGDDLAKDLELLQQGELVLADPGNVALDLLQLGVVHCAPLSPLARDERKRARPGTPERWPTKAKLQAARTRRNDVSRSACSF